MNDDPSDETNRSPGDQILKISVWTRQIDSRSNLPCNPSQVCVFFVICICLLLSNRSWSQGMVRSAPDNKEAFHRLLLDTLNIQTGDMVLFKSNHFASRLTQFGTFSPFSHCGMVVRDPDGQLWITHATDNEYETYRLQVKDEDVPRGGVIMTRLEDSFFGNGYYPKIYIYKLDESHFPRPTPEMVNAIYQKYKQYKFEVSPIRFALASFDLDVFGYDILSLPDHPKIFCSEYQIYMLMELGLLTDPQEAPNEYTPRDITNLRCYRRFAPVMFTYRK